MQDRPTSSTRLSRDPRGDRDPYAPFSETTTLWLTKACEWEGCRKLGEYPAPRSRHALREWRWFCLEHVREYNKNWNYFRDCDEDEARAEVKRDGHWQRPSWRMGTGPSTFHVREGMSDVDDPLEVLARKGFGPKPGSRQARARLAVADDPVRAALELFGLEPGATREEIKARYKTLVKSHHPDANRDADGASDRLARINDAYATLRAQF